MYSKIVNPKTGRKVSISGRIGRQVIARYRQQVGGVIGRAHLDEFCGDQNDGEFSVELAEERAANQEPAQDLKTSSPILYNQIKKF